MGCLRSFESQRLGCLQVLDSLQQHTRRNFEVLDDQILLFFESFHLRAQVLYLPSLALYDLHHLTLRHVLVAFLYNICPVFIGFQVLFSIRVRVSLAALGVLIQAQIAKVHASHGFTQLLLVLLQRRIGEEGDEIKWLVLRHFRGFRWVYHYNF